MKNFAQGIITLLIVAQSASVQAQDKTETPKASPKEIKCAANDSFECFSLGYDLMKKKKSEEAETYFKKACDIANKHIWAEDLKKGEKEDVYFECYTDIFKTLNPQEMKKNFETNKVPLMNKKDCFNPFIFTSNTLPINFYYKLKGEDICIEQLQLSKDEYQICEIGGFENLGRARNSFEYMQFRFAHNKYSCKKVSSKNKKIIKTKAELLKVTDKIPSQKELNGLKSSEAGQHVESRNFRQKCDNLQSANDCLLFAESLKSFKNFKENDKLQDEYKKYRLKACAYGEKKACK